MRLFSRFTSQILASLLLLSSASAAKKAKTDDLPGPKPQELDTTFRESIKSGYWLIKHYSPSCYHCKAMAPAWHSMYSTYANDIDTLANTYNFHIANLNCLAYSDLCVDLDIHSFPTVLLYKDGKAMAQYNPKSKRNPKDYVEFVERRLEKIKPGTRSKTISIPGETSDLTIDYSTTDKSYVAVKPKAQTTATEEVTPTAEATMETENSESKEKILSSGHKKPAAKSSASDPTVNPNGVSVDFTAASFNREVSATHAPWFIKFYAPWCSHCQALAPAWKQLGKEMKGKLNVGEVNCEVEKKLCNEVGLHGYPTILFFKGGERVEYDGLRGLGDLVNYAKKAASSGIRDIDAKDFEELEEEEEVMFLYFYDSATTSEDFGALDRVVLSLIGHAPLLKTNSTLLANKFRVNTWPKLLVIRDGRPTYYNALSPKDMRDHRKVFSWMKSVWLPMVPELSAANSHEIMNNRIVVLGVFDRSREDEFAAAKREIKNAAMQWLDMRQGEEKTERQELRDRKQLKIEEAEDRGDERALRAAKNIHIVLKEKREIGFAWIDGVFWERWLRTTYGMDVREGERIIVNDEDNKKYWDTTVDGSAILPSRSTILETIKDILASPSRIQSKSTVGTIESAIFHFKKSITNHPIWTVLFCIAACIVVFVYLRGRGGRRIRSGSFGLGSVRLPEVEKMGHFGNGGSPAGGFLASIFGGAGGNSGKFD